MLNAYVLAQVSVGRLVCVREGGYHPGGLADGMVAVIDAKDPRNRLGAGAEVARGSTMVLARPGAAVRAALALTRSTHGAARRLP